eukprot:NODE_341_length_1606_cov_57.171484_g257_i0.p1 GENE.NODE_341_length_1606_cov_57.171484_g257_i0~~NODE_341_length_1606_cov_57.171484_g257_i0.p1  ORF type:complete len:231 (+),score=89.55 NODE_341_length_1606_cov_57.171484_g257_i0:617-1309(+)
MFDPRLHVGIRVRSITVGMETVFDQGHVRVDKVFRVATLDYMADGGDGYPFTSLSAPGRADLASARRTGLATFAPDFGEQDALAEHLMALYTPGQPFAVDDVPPKDDRRIRDMSFVPEKLVEEEEGDIEEEDEEQDGYSVASVILIIGPLLALVGLVGGIACVCLLRCFLSHRSRLAAYDRMPVLKPGRGLPDDDFHLSVPDHRPPVEDDSAGRACSSADIVIDLPPHRR